MAHINPFALGATNWIGIGVSVCGAILVAFNLGVVAYGFALFLVFSCCGVRSTEAELTRQIA